MLKFITGSKQKFLEMKRALFPLPIEQLEVDLEEIQELDPHKVMTHKLREAFKHHKGEFILEDESFYLESLNYKLPGPLIKWFNITVGNKLMLELANKTKRKGAKLLALVAYAKSPKEIKFISAKVSGTLVKPKGDYGFYFDFIFQPKGYKETYSELKGRGEFKPSARAQVAKKLQKYLTADKSANYR